MADLNCLKANSLTAANASRAYISGLLDEAEKKNGWLVLYGHGVKPNPGLHDISPETLEMILSECEKRRIPVLPIARALQVIRGSESRTATAAG